MTFYKRRFVALAAFFLGIIFALPSPQGFVNFLMGGFVGLFFIWFSKPIGKWLTVTGTGKPMPPVFVELTGWGIILINSLVFFVI